MRNDKTSFQYIDYVCTFEALFKYFTYRNIEIQAFHAGDLIVKS